MATEPFTVVRFEVDGLGKPIVHEFSDRSRAWFELHCLEVGEVTIKQHVMGPGGEDRASRTLRIASRATQPKADFVVQQTKGNGTAQVRFIGRSQGSVDRVELDPGDGSPVQSFASATDIVHPYRVGTWFPKITVYPVQKEGLSPSTWVGPEIEVVEPMSDAARNLRWQIPGGLCVGLLGLFWALKCRESDIKRRQSRIAGHLSVHRSGKPRSSQPFDFSGERNEETVQLDGSTSLKLSSQGNESGSLEVQLLRNGVVIERKEFDETGRVCLGDYIVKYTA